ncbi:MAG: CGNR zinc finger domain-containing protein [Actinomycetota bacterium]|nr:CGNR zinc finger domain-containing protein [Actinomycetota bacterium]
MDEKVHKLVTGNNFAESLRFDGGSPLFNLLATKGARGRGAVERLADDEKIATFLDRALGVTDDIVQGDLISIGSRLIAVRDAIEAIFSFQIFGVESNKVEAYKAAEFLNGLIAAQGSHRRFGIDSHGAIITESAASTLDSRVVDIVSEALDLLSFSEKRSRVKVCANESCQAIFMDRSPTNNRIWCSMAICGNRAKARRYYHSNR